MLEPGQTSTPALNLDVFSTVLSHISHPQTIHNLLRAIPPWHALFPAALARRTALPVYLDVYHGKTEAASKELFDCLLEDNSSSLPFLRHLSIAIEPQTVNGGLNDPLSDNARAIYHNLSNLVRRCPGLRKLEYHSFPGLAELAQLEQLRDFAVDCSLGSSAAGVSGGGDYAQPGELSAEFDGEIWELEPFASTVGPKLNALELRHVNHTFYNTMLTKRSVFSLYTKLKHLTMDITDGVWDWRGGGSPISGASPEFKFQHLGFPAVDTFDLRVCDLTLSGATVGPLNMVSCQRLTELRILVRYRFGFPPILSYFRRVSRSLDFGGHAALWDNKIRLFEALSPNALPALRLLELKDNAHNMRYLWDANSDRFSHHPGRQYPGFVPTFLGAGALTNLTHLWVDEQILVHPDQAYNVFRSDAPEDVLWVSALRMAFSQLVSVRVGFGPLNDGVVDFVFGLCDPKKLREFGFEWDWHAYGYDEALSTKLLGCLTSFSLLTDIHFLFPRPTKEPKTLPYPATDPRTLTDISTIFAAHPNVSRVGVGNSILWERHSPAPLLVSDGKNGPDASIPRFFQAGYMFCKSLYNADNYEPLRPERVEEIEEMRDLLKRILV
ncbi:hypothetical protein C8F01DRAFT_1152781 [Mycena amicta]|nr:hypothetical protein C8F01DRAFT_1152781 [Mycena amicta]